MATAETALAKNIARKPNESRPANQHRTGAVPDQPDKIAFEPHCGIDKNRLMFDRLNSGRPFPSMKPTHEELKARLTGRGSLKRHVTSVSRLLKTLIENPLRGETNSRDERKGYRFHRLRKLFTAHARATGSASFLGRSLHALNWRPQLQLQAFGYRNPAGP